MTETRTKLSILKEFMAGDDWISALRLANSFGDLGSHKQAITRAWNAHLRPEFYREIGQNPDELFAAGIRALKERYP